MLQMLPLMSRDKALALLASHPDCSCPRSLFDFYNNINNNNTNTTSSSSGSSGATAGAAPAPAAPLTAQQKMLLLQNSFGAGAARAQFRFLHYSTNFI